VLAALTIRDLAVVDSVDLEFREGMTALTGETGAGKSILVDAIGLVLGDRADSGMIRADSDRAEITASFNIGAIPDARQWLDQHAIDHDGECLLRRVLVRDGRSRAFVNGTPVTVGDLAGLGEKLLDIHGQHAHQSLTRRGHQRELLDAFGGHEPLAAEVAAAFESLADLRRRLQKLRAAADERNSRLDLLRFQIGELEALSPQADEWVALEAEHRRLSNAEVLREKSGTLAALLYDENGARDGLDRAVDLLADLATVDPALNESLEMARSALIQVQEVRPTLQDYADRVELDPARLREIDERIGLLHAAARKFRVAPEELPGHLETLRDELGTLDDADAAIAGLEAQETGLQQAFDTRAEKLSAARAKAAKKLAREITASMKTLNMSGGHFDVQLSALEAGKAGPHGAESVTFLVAANPGQAPKPLAQVASGGELSRISLAIQVATAECSRIPTLIFDEVDVGIGGGVAEIVGRLLHRVAESRQVLCVTHLPQVAAQADHHLRVDKEEKQGATRTRIRPLDADGRIQELARMLGGVRITKQTLAHAREMLSLAAAS
jgi:DNA repair protein RecN (Recombination protein N)